MQVARDFGIAWVWGRQGQRLSNEHRGLRGVHPLRENLTTQSDEDDEDEVETTEITEDEAVLNMETTIQQLVESFQIFVFTFIIF